jgi:hypothetical protein
MVVLANRCATARAAQIWQANRVSKLLITTCGQQKARSTTMSKGFSEAERQIVTALIETNAVNFEALGAVLAKNGASATLNMDGEDWFCGTMRRFIRVFRLADNITSLEDLANLSRVNREMQG